MKQRQVCVLLLFILMILLLPGSVFAARDITVYLDGKQLFFDTTPIVINDRTMVPMRVIFEALGAAIEWDGDTGSIDASADGISIHLQIESRSMYLNGKEIILDTAPVIRDNRTLVPVRAVSEGMHTDVSWEASTSTVILTSEARKGLLLYRQQLDDLEKQMYDCLYINCVKGVLDFSVPELYNKADFQAIFWCMFNDCPEFFWLNSSFVYRYNDSNIVTSVAIGANGLQPYTPFFYESAAPVLKKARSLRSRVEQIKYIHNYLINTVKYDLSAEYNQSAYSAIVHQRSVCVGYARAFEYFMHELSIPCGFVSGTSSGTEHAWNIVELDGVYYNVDVTNDSTDWGPIYEYFLVSDSTISRTHKRTGISWMMPACKADYEESYPRSR